MEVVKREKGGNGRLGPNVGCDRAADEDCLKEEEAEHLYLSQHVEEEEDDAESR